MAKTETPTSTTVVEDGPSEWIEMSKGACYGTCPIYTMTIHKNGITKFVGENFCEKIGPHIAQLSEDQIKILKQHISGIQVDELPEKFESMIADLPGTKITFHKEDGTSKSVWWNMDAPENLNDLSVFIDTYRADLTWQVDNDAPLPEGAIENQFMIFLKEGVSASDFAKQYSEYDFLPKREIIPEDFYWLFEFDTSKITPHEMYILLRKSEKIQNVQFNNKVSER